MRRGETTPRTGDMVRRAARWHAPRHVSNEDLRDLAELLVRDPAGEPLLARVAHQLAAWSRFAAPSTAILNMVRDHDDRVARGKASSLPPLGRKALGFRRCWSNRTSWAWLACR
jgi:hypothetical protein